MTVLPLAKRIVGYADEQSVAAGDDLAFCVSGDGGASYALSVHRLLGGASAPIGPPLRTERVADLGSFPLLPQVTTPGSYGVAEILGDHKLEAATVIVKVQPWLRSGDQAIVQLRGESDAIELGLDDSGRAYLDMPTGRLLGPLVPERPAWTTLVAAFDGARASLAVGTEAAWEVQDSPLGCTEAVQLQAVLIGAARGEEGSHRHFCGRIERPAVLRGYFEPDQAACLIGGQGVPSQDEALLLWEFSDSLDTWSVPGAGVLATPLVLHNAPKRAVRGSSWVDAEDWRQAPTQYSAIHFYSDSLEDCGWTKQASWQVPPQARSGFYAAHVVSGEDEDWIPFFVRCSPAQTPSDVLVVASTATYSAYANSRFWWEDPIQEVAQDRLVELGMEEQYLVLHPELGLSHYDAHADGSAVVFSSRRRPNLFMRPGHSRGESYASDLLLIAWLERLGLTYDVVTDEDLHFDALRGSETTLLDTYRVVLSGSHPEYLSVAMFDAFQQWVRSGGRFVYAGGNGFTSNVSWSAERPWLLENRTTGRLRADPEARRSEARHQLDGEPGLLMEDIGRATGSLWGVDFVTMGFDRAYPVRRSDQSYLPEFAFAFEGIGPRIFGGRGMFGGVIGQEWDNARRMLGTAGHFVLASSIDHSLIPEVLGSESPHHGDGVLHFVGEGAVFSAASMAWAGALHIDDYCNEAERFFRNVLTRFLDPAPIAQPVAAEGEPHADR